MRKKMFAFFFAIVFVELIVIIVLLAERTSLSEHQEFFFSINNKRQHAFSVSSSNLYLNVKMADNKSLQNIFITDNIGREVNIVYSELGIVNYHIIDESCKYKMSSDFADNYVFTGNRILADPNMAEPKSEIINIRPRSIFREEKYNDGQKKYTIDYTTAPYFFDW